jgi:hypothetical protein
LRVSRYRFQAPSTLGVITRCKRSASSSCNRPSSVMPAAWRIPLSGYRAIDISQHLDESLCNRHRHRRSRRPPLLPGGRQWSAAARGSPHYGPSGPGPAFTAHITVGACIERLVTAIGRQHPGLAVANRDLGNKHRIDATDQRPRGLPSLQAPAG